MTLGAALSHMSCSELVGWVERSDTHHRAVRKSDGFRKGSTHPTRLRGADLNEIKSDKAWSYSVASIAVSTLIVAGVLDSSQQERATEIVAEEILVRLAIGDRPTAAQENSLKP